MRGRFPEDTSIEIQARNPNRWNILATFRHLNDMEGRARGRAAARSLTFKGR